MISFLTDFPWSIGFGLLISIVIAYVAYRRHSLDQSGFYAAIVTGTIIFACGGWYFMIVLLMFFISSSLVSQIRRTTNEHSLRSYKQVLANGGVGVVLAVMYFLYDDELYRILYTISFAVATADTWAGEIGRLAKSPPRHILTFQQVEIGVSGGVTPLGTIASLLGSTFIAAFLSFHPHVILWGFLGSIVDSLLGTLQIKYVTTSGRVLDEPVPEDDVVRTIGLRFLSNNLVNFLTNLIIVVVAYFVIR